MWRDDEERKAVLASLGPDRPLKERLKAAVVLRRCAVGDHREALWADAEVRAAVKAIVEPAQGQEPEPTGIISAALGLLLNVTASTANCLKVLRDPELRGAILGAMHKLRPEPVQTGSALVAVNLLFAAAGALSPEELREVHSVLGAAIAQGRLPRVRCAVLGALWTAASAEPQEMWRRPAIREEVLVCAGAGEPEDVRASALGVLWAVSLGGLEQQEALWEHESVRQALLEGVSPEQPPAVRTGALQGLRALAAAPSNCTDMWGQDTLRSAVLDGAAEGQRVPLREASLELLAQLTASRVNRVQMLDAGVCSVFEAAVDDEHLQSHIRRMCRFSCTAVAEAEAWREEEVDDDAGEDGQEQQQQQQQHGQKQKPGEQENTRP